MSVRNGTKRETDDLSKADWRMDGINGALLHGLNIVGIGRPLLASRPQASARTQRGDWGAFGPFSQVLRHNACYVTLWWEKISLGGLHEETCYRCSCTVHVGRVGQCDGATSHDAQADDAASYDAQAYGHVFGRPGLGELYVRGQGNQATGL
jgi:hypothetical protein